nr:hypothetical protein StreXyl84_00720 [Streptomyces sp. Xyl84]
MNKANSSKARAVPFRASAAAAPAGFRARLVPDHLLRPGHDLGEQVIGFRRGALPLQEHDQARGAARPRRHGHARPGRVRAGQWVAALVEDLASAQDGEAVGSGFRAGYRGAPVRALCPPTTRHPVRCPDGSDRAERGWVGTAAGR